MYKLPIALEYSKKNYFGIALLGKFYSHSVLFVVINHN